MKRSEQIQELAGAMAKAQAEMTGAKKDSTNPHFRSAYADLASVREASLPHLNKHGISVMQFPRLVSCGEHEWNVEVETMLTHESGQYISDTLAVIVSKPDAQGIGSAITYARRYALGAIAGVAPEDDDANAAVGDARGAAMASTNTVPSGAMETVTTKVKNVTMNDKGRIPKYTVYGTNGKQYTTIKKIDAATAKSALESGLPVQITFALSQWGQDIKSIEEMPSEVLDELPA
jgi:hypothetical protein